MKTAILAVTAIVLTSSAALAAPSKHYAYRSHDDRGNVSSYERAAIARSAQHLASIKRRAWADGKLTFFERFQIRIAENSYSRLVHRAWRS